MENSPYTTKYVLFSLFCWYVSVDMAQHALGYCKTIAQNATKKHTQSLVHLHWNAPGIPTILSSSRALTDSSRGVCVLSGFVVQSPSL